MTSCETLTTLETGDQEPRCVVYADIADNNDKGRGVETHDRPGLDTVLVGVPLPAPAPAPDGRLTSGGRRPVCNRN